MMLLLDIGNTRLKWCYVRDGVLGPASALVHHGAPAEVITQLARTPVQAIWVAQVMGIEHQSRIAQACLQHFGVQASFAMAHAEQAGVRSAYADANRLGVDRWLMLLAGRHAGAGSFSVASAGTALTFDAVDAAGQHLGGVIAPGVQGMIRTTLGATRFATHTFTNDFHHGLGQHTEACVQQGAVHAATGLLQNLHQQYAGPTYLCGGDAPLLAQWLQGQWRLEPDLVLHGLWRYAQTYAGPSA